jgi:hypothetical protein
VAKIALEKIRFIESDMVGAFQIFVLKKKLLTPSVVANPDGGY